MISTLREENERLEKELETYRAREAGRIDEDVTTGKHAVGGLVQALQVLARAMPNTVEGRKALADARNFLSHHGVPMPVALEKIPKPPKRKRVKRAKKKP